MIKPLLQGEAFLNDVRNALNVKDELNIWWLGQSGFLVQWNNQHLLFDPYLSDSLTRKYKLTNKPHTRMTEQVVSPEKLNFINIDFLNSWIGSLLYFIIMLLSILALNSQQKYLIKINSFSTEPIKMENTFIEDGNVINKQEEN